LAFRVPVGTTTAPFETFVANPAPVEVAGGVVPPPATGAVGVVAIDVLPATLAAMSAVGVVVTGGPPATLGAVVTVGGTVPAGAAPGLVVDAIVVVIVVDALVVVMVVAPFAVVIVVDGGTALALAVGLGMGATLET
jgi:hypothetical protein